MIGFMGVVLLIAGGKVLEANPDAFKGAGEAGNVLVTGGLIAAVIWVLVLGIALIGAAAVGNKVRR